MRLSSNRIFILPSVVLQFDIAPALYLVFPISHDRHCADLLRIPRSGVRQGRALHRRYDPDSLGLRSDNRVIHTTSNVHVSPPSLLPSLQSRTIPSHRSWGFHSDRHLRLSSPRRHLTGTTSRSH